jgi:hypothetical protein
VSPTNRRMTAAGIVLALAVLHHDFWLWENASLVFGFVPAGLAYHASFSVVAGLAWAVVVFLVWPKDDDVDSGEEA